MRANLSVLKAYHLLKKYHVYVHKINKLTHEKLRSEQCVTCINYGGWGVVHSWTIIRKNPGVHVVLQKNISPCVNHNTRKISWRGVRWNEFIHLTNDTKMARSSVVGTLLNKSDSEWFPSFEPQEGYFRLAFLRCCRINQPGARDWYTVYRFNLLPRVFVVAFMTVPASSLLLRLGIL